MSLPDYIQPGATVKASYTGMVVTAGDDYVRIQPDGDGDVIRVDVRPGCEVELIEAAPLPPIDEPTGLGAVIERTEAGGPKLKWTLAPSVGRALPWLCPDRGLRSEWSRLTGGGAQVEVLSPGYVEPPKGGTGIEYRPGPDANKPTRTLYGHDDVPADFAQCVDNNGRTWSRNDWDCRTQHITWTRTGDGFVWQHPDMRFPLMEIPT